MHPVIPMWCLGRTASGRHDNCGGARQHRIISVDKYPGGERHGISHGLQQWLHRCRIQIVGITNVKGLFVPDSHPCGVLESN